MINANVYLYGGKNCFKKQDSDLMLSNIYHDLDFS